MDIEEAIIHAKQVAEGCVSGSDCAYQHDKLADWLEELQVYRNTGLTPEEVIKLKDSCRVDVGDTVYILTKYRKWEIVEVRVTRKTVKSRKTFTVNGLNENGNYYNGTFVDNSIGKTVFLSRQEAEKALKRKGSSLPETTCDIPMPETVKPPKIDGIAKCIDGITECCGYDFGAVDVRNLNFCPNCSKILIHQTKI